MSKQPATVASSAALNGRYQKVRRVVHPRVALLSNRHRALPDFVIIGAQRCGTTSMFQYLRSHPQLELPRVKEIHYFDNNFHRGVNWYRAHFPSLITITAARAVGQRVVTGEASPYYLFHPLVSKRLHDLIPSAKLVVLLRNPVDRAYSHYQHIARLGIERLSFEEALALEPERLDGEAERIIDDETYRSAAHQHFSYLARGIYADQIQSWRRWFPAEQLLVIPSEEIYRSPSGALEKFETFIGVDRWLPSSFKIHNEGVYQPMNPRTREDLVEYFRPHNQRLFEYLGREFDWDK